MSATLNAYFLLVFTHENLTTLPDADQVFRGRKIIEPQQNKSAVNQRDRCECDSVIYLVSLIIRYRQVTTNQPNYIYTITTLPSCICTLTVLYCSFFHSLLFICFSIHYIRCFGKTNDFAETTFFANMLYRRAPKDFVFFSIEQCNHKFVPSGFNPCLILTNRSECVCT